MQISARVSALFLIFLFSLGTVASAQARESRDSTLIDAEFAVPDLSDRVILLEQRFAALAARLEAMEAQQDLEGVDARLEELFLPERPDRFRREYRRELALLAENAGDLGLWLDLAGHYLKRGRLDDAAAAAFHVYQSGHQNGQRAEALDTMAEAILAEGGVRQALNLYWVGLGLQQSWDRQQRYDTLVARYDLRLRDISLNAEQSIPSACLVFTQNLKKPLPLLPGDYVEVNPAGDIAIDAKGNQICLRGLAHGGEYQVTIRKGLLGEHDAQLYRDQQRHFAVPDRRQRIAFTANSYVLPKSSGQTLPVTTVNLDHIKLKLYQIRDRNLIAAVIAGLLDQNLYPGDETQVEETMGQLVWDGEVTVDLKRNQETASLIPLSEMLGAREAGVYALVARLPKETDDDRWQPHATQWLVVSDLGLTVFEGADGLTVLTRSLSTAGPLSAASLTLIARNNERLGEVQSDATGLARFAPGLLRGKGGDQPALLTVATAEGDYNFLRLTGPYLDLSERGVTGRPAPGELDAFLYSERGVYRPGETVHLSILLRDFQARAVGGLPLTVKVVRPGGTEVFDKILTGDSFGGYATEVPLSGAARAGSWRATAYVDEGKTPIGSVSFAVEDFVPQRIAATLQSELDWLEPNQSADFLLNGKFLYGPPAANLKTEARLSLMVDPAPFEGYGDYHFGLQQETFRPERRQVGSPVTDGQGDARIAVELADVPDSSHPIRALLQVSLFDVGGRPVTVSAAMPIRARPVEVGLRPGFAGGVGQGAMAQFDIVALDPAGQAVPGRKFAYEWVREHYDYSWYSQNGEWRTRQVIYDEVMATGEADAGAHGKAQIMREFDYGRYRLDVFDSAGTSAASYRFYAGWWSASQAPDTPDALDLNLEQADLPDGGVLKAFVQAPFAGTAFVTVMSDRLHHSESLALPAEGAEIEIPVEGAWGPGAYLMVTAFRPDDGSPSRLPARAMGLAWFAIDRAQREAKVSLEVPEFVRPRQSITLPLKVEGAAGQPLRLTLAAVDEGILLLTDFETPAPADHFLGQRRLGVDLRDLYGRLIASQEGFRGALRSGGDGARARSQENVQGNSLKTVKTVALYQRDIVPDDQGGARVTLDLPDFNGRLRLMAVAYGAAIVGSGEAGLIVRDPVVADLLLPRFLAPGDEAQATLSLHNLTGAMASFEIELDANGIVALGNSAELTIQLDDEERYETVVPIKGAQVGDGHLTLKVTAGGDTPAVTRDWDIAVRPAQGYVTRRQVAYLAPQESLSYSADALSGFWPETAAANLTVAARPEFNVPALLDSLDRYPYGCSEQTVSRALPLLYFSDLARQWQKDPKALEVGRNIDRSILRVLERQRGDGSFSSWSSFGRPRPWLTAYVFDFLTQAREAGFDVPQAAYSHTQNWLRRYVSQRNSKELFAKAYGFYVLARIGEMRASEVRYFAQTYGRDIRTRLGLGHLAAALAILGEAERAEGLFEDAIAQRRPTGIWFDDYGSDLRDGAAITALLSAAFPQSERQQRLAETLEREFDRRQYFSTQEEAWLLLATHALSSGPGSDLTVDLNGNRIGPQKEAVRLSLDAAGIAAGVTLQNRGTAPLRFIQSGRGVPRDALPAAAEGFSLKRTVFDFDGALTDLEALTQNQLVVVLIEGESENETEQEVLIVDLLPAGLEIENAALGGLAGQGGFSFLPPLSNFDFEAARDDRYVAAVRLQPSRRKFAAAYVARAVTPGRYALPGSFVEDMYQPRYHARLSTSSLTVERP